MLRNGRNLMTVQLWCAGRYKLLIAMRSFDAVPSRILTLALLGRYKLLLPLWFSQGSSDFPKA